MIAPTMSDLLTALRAHLASEKRASRTTKTYTKIAGAFLGTLSGSVPSAVAIEDFLGRTRRDGAPRATAARNQELAALRSLAKVAVRQKSWESNPTEGVPFIRKKPHDPPFLGADELRQLFRTAAETPPAGEGPQILAILGLLSQTGLRVHELVGLNRSQVDLATATLLSVRGKGDTIHDLPLNAPAVTLLSAWLRARTDRAPPGEQALFISARHTRLSIRTVENWFVKLRVPMGTAKRVTPHTLRHSAATLALTMGTDLATVAELLRHRDLNTTRGYLHLVDTRRREAVRLLAVTVPREVLEAAGTASKASDSTAALPADGSHPKFAESPPSRRAEDLDDQYRLVALSLPARPLEGSPSPIINAPSPGALMASHDGEETLDLRGGRGVVMNTHVTLLMVVCCLLACSSDGTPRPNDAGTSGQSDATSACFPANCDDGVACTVDRCQSGVCTHMPDSSRCPVGQMCELRGCASNRPCAMDRDCADSDPCTVAERCDPVTRVCMSQVLDGDRDGHAPRSCGGSDCNDSDPLISPTAREDCNNADENCNGLIDEGADDSCPRGAFCRAGMCECRITCGTACSDLMTDASNCGRCGNRCPENAVCVSGQCACPSSASDMCGGACTSLRGDFSNCGACGHSCSGGIHDPELFDSCAAGECHCPPSFDSCMVNGRRTCIHLMFSSEHCGSCGHRCPVPMNGSAACNFGSCGFRCNAGFYRRGSQCVPPTCEGFSAACDPLGDSGCDEGEHCSVVIRELESRTSIVTYECQEGGYGARAILEPCSRQDRCRQGLVCEIVNAAAGATTGYCIMPCCGPTDARCGALGCGSESRNTPPAGYFCRPRG